MAASTIEALIDLLSPEELTVTAQTVPPNDQDELKWDQFFPRENVPSIKIASVSTIDYRPTADRREWNARGRYIPLPKPPRREVEIVPVEARHKIDEREMQFLFQENGGNAARILDIIGATIPQRVVTMARSCYRRIEVDAFTAWATGTIVQKNPETGQTYTASFDFDTDRYTSVQTAWDDPGEDAYENFLAWVVAAEDMVGPISGAMLRLATLNAILADAPDLGNQVSMTRSALEERIAEDLKKPFTFVVNERTVHTFTDGGLAYGPVNLWPADTIAAIPAGTRVGRTAFAPIVRAYELQTVPGFQGIDTNGVTAYYLPSNGGKELEIQTQLNALPIPDENLMYVTDVGA